ncbi:MAG: GtrA family protein [Bacilli bacterium]|nr:GtrA family protein [Bacilli bacterium]
MIKKIMMKYEEIIKYVIAGVCTTIVSLLVYNLLRNINVDYQVSNVISWICAVTFAYFINKYYVFKNKEKSLIEFFNFVKYRILSLGIEIGSMFILVSMLSINDRISKLIVQVIVQVLNYVFSKLFVFKKKI